RARRRVRCGAREGAVAAVRALGGAVRRDRRLAARAPLLRRGLLRDPCIAPRSLRRARRPARAGGRDARGAERPPARHDGRARVPGGVARVSRLRLIAAGVVPFALTWPLLFRGGATDGDIPVFRGYGDLIVSGSVPYRDFHPEYPPGAMAFFALPSLAPDHLYLVLFQIL